MASSAGSGSVRFDDTLNTSFGYHSDASLLEAPQRSRHRPAVASGSNGGGGARQPPQQQQQQQHSLANTSLTSTSTLLGDGDSSSGGNVVGKHVVLAVHLHPQTMTVGAASYNAESGCLSICPDFQESANYEFLAQLVAATEPTSLLTSAKLKESVSSKIAALVVDGGLQDVTAMKVKTSRDFDYDLAIERIRSTELPAVDVKRSTTSMMVDEQLEGTLRSGTLLDLDAKMMVGAIGALLKHIQENRTGIELEDSFQEVPILSLRVLPLASLVVMSKGKGQRGCIAHTCTVHTMRARFACPLYKKRGRV